MEYMKKGKGDIKGVNIFRIGLWFEVSEIWLPTGEETIIHL